MIPAGVLDTGGLSADQVRAVTAIATSPWLIQPLQAPAGAGKTHSLKALRVGANRVGKTVLVLTPTGRALDVALADGAGDAGHTIDLALKQLRGLVRDPDSEPAAALVALGASTVRADLDDAASVRAAFADVAGVFVMTSLDRGTDGEVEHGRTIADATVAASVPYVVYSSVGGAERSTGIPHFESKWQVELYLRKTGVPLSVVRPTFFMENFAGYFAPKVEDAVSVVRAPLLADVPLQMVAVADIGRVAATFLLDPDRFAGSALEIGGDELTAEQVAGAFGRHAGLSFRFEPIPVDALGDSDQEAMFAWFRHLPAYTADFAATRALLPDVVDFAAFVAQQS